MATPTVAYRAMRKVWPHVPDLRRRLLRHSAPPGVPREPARGFLAGLDVAALAEQVRCDGFVVLDRRLPAAQCDALARLASTAPARPAGGQPIVVVDPDGLPAPRYDLDELDLLADPDVQRLVVDPSLRALAETYLAGEAVSDLTAMWWSVAQPGGPSSTAAQLFHTDRDRLSFVKVFVYLTDVDDEHGPHVFVRGSHRRLPVGLRADRRYDDDEVAAAFGRHAIVTVAGRRGTVFVADTAGLHKGRPPSAGHRLVFQLEYATSLFGAPYVRCGPEVLAPEVLAAARSHPRAYARLLAA